ncbi:heat shock protein beta-9 [Genypterus blacodes]|uniref:heat shock protein beta-9 n=1 Tax=Genypterus blacodes TaxID=154954 RepID=UPI003F775BCA
MMAQRLALSSLFGEDPFFNQERLLWPLHRGALTSLQQDFFNRRAKLADSLLTELHDGPHMLQLRPFNRSPFSRLSDGKEQQKQSPSMELRQEAQPTTENGSDLLVTLDARGYAPNDITVKLDGRSLAVVAMKQDGAEASQSCSSPSSAASFCSSASSQVGFAQRIDLPDHLDLSGLSCSLMDDGQLRIHAPVVKQAITEERQVPVRFRSALEFPITSDETEDKHTE